jgi:hypothetical protein
MFLLRITYPISYGKIKEKYNGSTTGNNGLGEETRREPIQKLCSIFCIGFLRINREG